MLLMDHVITRAKYSQARVVEVHPFDGGITRHVRIMTANMNKVNPPLPGQHTYLDRDSTKIALVEFPLFNPLSERLQFTLSDSPVDALFGLRVPPQHHF